MAEGGQDCLLDTYTWKSHRHLKFNVYQEEFFTSSVCHAWPVDIVKKKQQDPNGVSCAKLCVSKPSLNT